MQLPEKKYDGSPLLSVSLLGADWLNFGDAVKVATDVGADLIQIDIADGIFTPTITFGEELVRRVKDVCDIPIEVHLMVSRPQDWISIMGDIGVDFVMFHVEAVQRLHSTIELVKQKGMGVGVVLNTETRPEVIEYILSYVDLITLMAILPGFAGQNFIPETYAKIKRLKEIIHRSDNCNVLIEVDGGVKSHNVSQIIEAGADIVLSSSAIYHSSDPYSAVRELRKSMVWPSNENDRKQRIHYYINKIYERRNNKKKVSINDK